MPVLYGQTLTVMELSDAQRKLGIVPAAMVPVGGGAADVLTKVTGADYDFAWLPPPAPVAGNGIVVAGFTVHFAQAAAYTAGALPFATGVATMGFDAANLFWDDANDRLGVGTGVPADRLHVTQAYADVANHTMANFVSTTSVVGGIKRGFQSDQSTTGAANFNAGLVSGGQVMSLHGGAGAVTGVLRILGLELYHGKSATGTGAISSCAGLYVQSVNLNATGAIADTYDIYVAAPVVTGAITTNYGVYQVSTAAYNFLGGNTSIGTATFAATTTLYVHKEYALTGAGVNAYGVWASLLNTNDGIDTQDNFHGGAFRVTTEGSQLYKGTVGTVGLSIDAVHNGTGQCDYLSGYRMFARKTSTGVVGACYGNYCHVRNENAVGAINNAYSFFAATPIVTGAITAYYGIYLATGAGTASYGVYQQGTDDLNCLLGKTGLGVAASATSWATLGASTATISSLRVTAGTAAYTGTVEGDFWNDYTQKCLVGYVDGLKQFDSRVVFVQTATVTVTNTDAETTLFGAGVGTLTFPANFFVVGKTIRLSLRGVHTMDATPPAITFRVKLGGVTFASVVYTDLNDTSQYIEINFVLTCRTTGGGGTGIGQGYILMSEVAGGANIDFEQLVMTATAAMNTTGALALDVTHQAAAADAGSSVTITNAVVEVLA